jgi:hypothetical protein
MNMCVNAEKTCNVHSMASHDEKAYKHLKLLLNEIRKCDNTNYHGLNYSQSIIENIQGILPSYLEHCSFANFDSKLKFMEDYLVSVCSQLQSYKHNYVESLIKMEFNPSLKRI